MQHKHATRPQALWSQLTRRRWSRWGISLIAVIAMLGGLLIWGCSDDNDIRIIVVNDTASTLEDRPVTINVLANDTREDDDDDDDGDDDDVTVTITTVPTNGTATVNEDNTITYTPNADFNGQDTFEYTVENGGDDDTNIATVTVTVIPVGEPATATALSNRAFVFDDGRVFGIAPLRTTTLTFGRFVNDTAPFLLETGNRMASGTATIASCDLQVIISTFGAAQGPQAGDQITLDPCLVEEDNGALTVTNDNDTVTNADDVTATSGPAIPSALIILPVALNGAQENPPVVTEATGTGILTVNAAQDTLTFALTYQGIATNVTMAHIHAGARGLNGGVIFFFCADADQNPPQGVRQCPEATEAPVTLSGTLTEDDFQDTTNPTLPVATFAEAVAAILAGNTYFNVHSANSPGGEIRGQVPPEPE